MDLLPHSDPDAATADIALRLQADLWERMPRAAGAFDVMIAAVAIQHDLTVVHYDADFAHLAEVSTLEQEWIVPRGTIDRLAPRRQPRCAVTRRLSFDQPIAPRTFLTARSVYPVPNPQGVR